MVVVVIGVGSGTEIGVGTETETGAGVGIETGAGVGTETGAGVGTVIVGSTVLGSVLYCGVWYSE